MSSKRMDLYEAVLKYIEKSVFKLKPEQFITDWESGMRKAISNVYPNAHLYGCWYHYCAAVRRKSRSLGHDELLKTNETAFGIYKRLLSLPLLPEHLFEEGYNHIKNMAITEKVKQLDNVFNYYENYWLKQVR